MLNPTLSEPQVGKIAMQYNSEAIRDLLLAAFNDEEFYTFCYDNFRKACRNFTTGQTQPARIQILIEYCDRTGNVPRLLRLIKKKNPYKYSEFASKLVEGQLDEHLHETLKLYLTKSFKDDQFARLDQAGETDPDRTTLLRQVFVDLEVKPREGQQPRRLRRRQLNLFEEPLPIAEDRRLVIREGSISAMQCFLQELWPKIVLIGGPGQGKSTLGQYLAQIHRATFLGYEEELHWYSSHGEDGKRDFLPKVTRVPFRIVLKYFAQWLADKQRIESVEAFIAEQMQKFTSRDVSPEDIQEILLALPSLVIFDGLDEVIEPDLRSRVLIRIEEFLERVEQLQSDLQMVATSRPMGYSNQFDPEQFWHLELQPMSVEKVRAYAHRWADAKAIDEEEKRRVLDTLDECQQEEHTRLLLATPLQVTIVLLIIKDGGRPPAQREALFHDYWSTIFRREKAKAKGVIRTEEQLLFDLHAYLGYLLHRRAAAENVRSLLPEAEFKQTVYDYLRSKDSLSPEDVIRQRATLMAEEARYRLYLIVEPEPGYFGFELRSIQEFFAATFLAQTARDTRQRFDRLKAIARSEHWRNVALFFCGRIVRNFSGEAANILELVCRPIDREPPDRYLRPGAWLALDIAADGAFAANRDLQYGALDHALTVLETGIPADGERHLRTALRRLSPDDRRDLLKPLLQQKVGALPLSCLAVGLDTYGRFIAADQSFIQGLEALLSSYKPRYVVTALNLAFEHQCESTWLVQQLERFRSIWAESDGAVATLWSWWQQAPRLVQEVLAEWSPPEDRVRRILTRLLQSTDWYLHRRFRGLSNLPDLSESTSDPSSPTDQLITALKCVELLAVMSEYSSRTDTERTEIKREGQIAFINVRESLGQRTAMLNEFERPISQYIKLLRRSDLTSPLRAILWTLYWWTHEPTAGEAAAFLAEVESWAEDKLAQPGVWLFRLTSTWPLMGLVVDRQLEGKQGTVKRLASSLSASLELTVNDMVHDVLQRFTKNATKEEWAEFILDLRLGTEIANPSELNTIAQNLGITVSDLIYAYISYWATDKTTYTSKEVGHIFSEIEKAVANQQEERVHIPLLTNAKWVLDTHAIDRGKRLLMTLIDRLPQRPSVINVAVGLFVKLLATDESVVGLVLPLCNALDQVDKSDLDRVPPWWFADHITDVPQRRLAELCRQTSSEEGVPNQGVLAFWEIVINAILAPHHFYVRDVSKRTRSKPLRLDWRLGVSCLNHADATVRRRGIAVLTLSDFPIRDLARRAELMAVMARVGEDDEIKVWARFMRHVPVPKSVTRDWMEFLESIMAQPRMYAPDILVAAIERYTSLVGEAASGMRGSEEALGLPVIATPVK